MQAHHGSAQCLRGWEERRQANAFEPGLLVVATEMSRPAQDRAIVDTGLKALAFDSVCDEPAATSARIGGGLR